MPSKKRSSGSDSHEYKFQKDEKVLVLPQKHNDDIYEAKILEHKLDSKSKEALYRIHYKGWNKRWDEWVNARRLLKINPTNIQIMTEKKAEIKAQQLQQIQEQQDDEEEQDNDIDDDEDEDYETNKNKNKNKKKRKLRNVDNVPAASKKKRRLNREDSVDKKKKNKNKNNKNGGRGEERETLEIKLPTQLKKSLIIDWENITKKSLLISLPRNVGVRITDILTDFEAFAIKSGQDKSIVTEISRGLKDYFNQALKVTLLYKLERSQYNNVTTHHQHLSMDEIYGAEHLCRLFVKLPQLLSPNDLDNDTKQILKQQIEFIIQYILTNKPKYFNTNYINANNV